VVYELFIPKVRGPAQPMTHDFKSPVKVAIVEAFSRLVLSRRATKPPVADILDEAGVARSTFYEHFNGRDMVLLEAMEAPLSLLADAAVHGVEGARLAALLEHFRENRRGAVDILAGPLGARVRRRLGELIAARLPVTEKEVAIDLANQVLAQIRLWLERETRHSAERLAALVIAGAAAFRVAFAARESL